MIWLAYLLLALAAAAWLVAVASCLRAAKHKADGVSCFWLATHGMAFFTGQNFKPSAAPDLQRFRRAAALFAVFAVGGVALAAAGTG